MKKQILSIALIVLMGFAVYANSFKAKFVFDDEALVENNLFIRSPAFLKNIFTQDIGEGSGKASGLYRPLQTLSYMLDRSLWGLDVRGYHCTNTVLHVLVAVSLYFLVFLLFNDRLLSFFTVLLFVVHPVHSEAVTYISGRADSLASLFMLLSFIFYIKSLEAERGYWSLLAVLAFALALLSRENVLIFPLAIILYHSIFKSKVHLKAFLPLLVLAVVYILVRLTLLRHLLITPEEKSFLIQRIPGFFVALSTYLGLLIFPFFLHMEYGSELFPWLHFCGLVGMLIVVAAVYCLRKRSKDRLLVFSIGWFFLMLLPQSNLYPLSAYMAEHWLYLPSIGFFLIVGRYLSSLMRFQPSRRRGIVLACGVVALFSILTIKQNTYWQDPIAFYRRTLVYAPKSFRAYNNIGKLYREEGNLGEAIASYRGALMIKSDYPYAHNNLGNALKDAGEPEEALIAYEKAILLDPSYANAYYNLGNLYNSLGQRAQAIEAYKKAVQLNPYDAVGLNNLGALYYLQEQYPQAIDAFKRAIAIRPSYSDACSNLGNVYKDMGDYSQAVAFYQQAIAVRPANASAHNNLAVAYYDLKEFGLAIRHCDRAVELGYRVHPEFLKLLEPYRK